MRYVAFGLAEAYGLSAPSYRIKRKYKGEPRGGWVYVYEGRKKVFDCNPTFFKTWFRKAP